MSKFLLIRISDFFMVTSCVIFLTCAVPVLPPWSPDTRALALDTLSMKLSLETPQNQNPPTQQFKVWNSGTGTLVYNVTSNATWLQISPSVDSSLDSSDKKAVSVSFNTALLEIGTYNANITISADGLSNINIPVSIKVIPDFHPELSLDTQVIFDTCYQGSTPSNDTFHIWNSGTGKLKFALNTGAAQWLICNPSNDSSNSLADKKTIVVSYPQASTLSIGTHLATISISNGSTILDTVEVKLTIIARALPIIATSKDSLLVSANQGTSPAARTFKIFNAGKGTLNFAVTSDSGWLTCAPSKGTSINDTNQTAIIVTFTSANLTAGTHNASITIKGDSDVVSKVIPVKIEVIPIEVPSITINTTSLNPICNSGTNAASLTFEVWNSGTGALSFTATKDSASWLALSIGSGTSTGASDKKTVSVSFTTASLSPGIYSSTITVGASGQSSKTISVSLNVGAVPAIALSATGLTASCNSGLNATAQSFDVWNGGSGSLSFSVAKDTASWLALSVASGASTGSSDKKTIATTFTTASLAPGAYVCTLTVSGTGVASRKIAVNLTVAAVPALSISSTSLSPSCSVGAIATAQSFDVWNSGTGTLNFTVSKDTASWYTLSTSNGTSTGSNDKKVILLTYTTSGLAPVTRTSTINVGGTGVTSQTITVTLTVNAVPALSISTTSLNPSCNAGSNALAQTFDVWNSGTGTLSFTVGKDAATWLSLSATSGTSLGGSTPDKKTMTISYATSGLAPGTYTSTITVGGTGVIAQTIGVNLTVGAVPSIALSATTLTPSCNSGANASSESFDVWNGGTGTLSFTISDDATWLAVTPSNGTSTGSSNIKTITVNYTTTTLAPGTYTGTITVAGTGLTSKTIVVTMTVNAVPSIALSATTLTPTCNAGSNATAGSFQVWNGGTGKLKFTVSSSATWITVSPVADSSTDATNKKTITVNYSTAALQAGNHSATISINGEGISVPQTVAVNLTNSGIVTFVNSAEDSNESKGAVSIPVRLTRTSNVTITVAYSRTGGTAPVGDYNFTAGTITFNPGDSIKTLPLTLVDNAFDQDDRTIIFTISSPTAAILGSYATNTFTIKDDDNAPTVSLSKPDTIANETSSSISFTVTLNAMSQKSIQVGYSTLNGTATGGVNFQATSGTLNFSAGTTVNTFLVPIIRDNWNRGNLNFSASITAVSNVSLGNPSAETVTLTDADSSTSIIYVKKGGAGAKTGTSWLNATDELITAFQLAATAGKSIIWVASGTYFPTTSTDKTISFILQPNMQLYGGFSGGEGLLSQRNVWRQSKTVLSGQISASTGGRSSTIITGATNSLVDGFTIEYSSLTAINCRAAPMTIRNCIIQSCVGKNGTAIRGPDSLLARAVVENVVFYGNYFGGSNSYIPATPFEGRGDFINCLFYKNSTYTGESVVASWGSKFVNCTFLDNTAQGGYGKAITCIPSRVDTIYNCILWRNSTPEFQLKGNFLTAGCVIDTNGLDLAYQNWTTGFSLYGIYEKRDPLFQADNGVTSVFGADGLLGGDIDALMVQPTSPAIGFGVNAVAPVYDITGKVSRLADPDAGAYEQ